MDCTVSVDLVPVSTIKVLFGVSGNTIRRWRKEEGLPFHVVVGNTNDIILYDMELVLIWADGLKTPFNLGAAMDHHSQRAKKWEALSKL